MRIFFFGDIHGNHYALEACLAHLNTLKPDEVFCLGDLVGWLPFGRHTLQRIRALGFPTVAGNHDLLVCGLFTDHAEQLDRMQATAYNAGLLDSLPEARKYLLGLPLALAGEDFVVVHHSPFHLPEPGKTPTIDCFNYLDQSVLAKCLGVWGQYPKRLIFSGHDHLPAVYELPAGTVPPRLEEVRIHRPDVSRPLVIKLNPKARYWIKAGSVGGPYRDGLPKANSVLYDSQAETITLFRIPFPTRQLSEDLTAHTFMRNLPTIRKYIDLLGP